jgi:predicted lysophospholipase L1 biosynthesis ABC-type transport system permease subunit
MTSFTYVYRFAQFLSLIALLWVLLATVPVFIQ